MPPGKKERPALTSPTLSTDTREGGQVPTIPSSLEGLFWETIKDSNDPAMFRAYLEKFPNGVFAPLARLNLEEANDASSETIPEGSNRETEAAKGRPSFEVQTLSATFYARKISNVRAGPGTEFEKVGRLTPGDEVAVSGKVVDKNWYRISLNGGADGYVYSALLSRDKDSNALKEAIELQSAIGEEFRLDSKLLQTFLEVPAFRDSPPLQASYREIRYRDGESVETYYRSLGHGWMASETKGDSWEKQELFALNGLVEIASFMRINDEHAKSTVTAVSNVSGNIFPMKIGNNMQFRFELTGRNGATSTRHYSVQVTRRVFGRAAGLPVEEQVYEVYIITDNIDYVKIGEIKRELKKRATNLYRYYIPSLGIFVPDGRLFSNVSGDCSP
jgi:uncharacterized protein YgiM (DUF1202 family)